ncbi:MAG: phosphoribosylaminoimidazolesuccinocarboxamide synthase [Desulfovibrio sp.]|jgi:phosphoribosylaminoimidazole-succinocarboxamide synthase|nr:phosphoribosylaminoimidazolesuccinocarboxamide synthase [Desulfovibrio sp.]
MQTVTTTHLTEYPLVARGKVRDIYAVSPDTLLMVSTDRMSAFDVVMNEPIPFKGVVLNLISLFWLNRFSGLVKNHLLESDVRHFPKKLRAHADMLEGRSILARKAATLPVECIVRGNLTGSGWKDYLAAGMVCGHKLPAGLLESQALPEPLFTPSTKAEIGTHDENITREEGMRLAGRDAFLQAEKLSLEIFRAAARYAAERGIIIADTKFEFGFIDGDLRLIDEVLTPDSSRFWPAERFTPGRAQPSFDKQYLRDWLETRDWDKSPPPPALPDEVVEESARKYREAYTLLTGEELPV